MMILMVLLQCPYRRRDQIANLRERLAHRKSSLSCLLPHIT
jgi:hypothetical protein